MNPLLPKNFYTPDVEARVWDDGRIYIYGSNDIPADTFYCSREYHVFSSDDMLHWTNHGVSFTGLETGDNHAVVPGILYAPDCVCKDGLYYLYYCQAHGEEGVAVSKSPIGPFTNAHIVEGANLTRIDPAVFIDDDGSAYYYWAQFSAYAAKLHPDMKGIIPETFIDGLITEKDHGFHEGISMRKIKGIYYLVYTDISRGRATSIGYAISNSPLGPFVKQGIIIDNSGCDPGTWNNHGSIQEYKGQWYVFYHRSSHASEYSRRVCAEPIFFDAEGKIAEVEMTTQGPEGPLNPTLNMDAANACLFSHGEHRRSSSRPNLHEHIHIESWSGDVFYEYITSIMNDDWFAYKYFNFNGDEKTFTIEASSMSLGGTLSLRLDSPDGEEIGSIRIGSTGGWFRWQKFQTSLTKSAKGKHALYLCSIGGEGRLFNIKSFRFIR